MVLGKLQCRGVLLIWIRVEQGPTAFAVVCLDIFLSSIIFPLFSLLPGKRPDID